MRAWFPASFLAICVTAVVWGVSIGSAQPPGNPAPAEPPKDKAAIYSELDRAPEKARVKRNPVENDPEAVSAGRNLFERHCAECHGDIAEGGHRGPSLRAAEVQNAPPGAIFWILTNGVVRRGMPVWSKLPEPQRWQLVAYLKSLGTKQSSGPQAQPTPPR